MILRQLSDDLVKALVEAPFWRRIIEDKELHPEIRDDRVTVYYSGCAIMRELNYQGGQLKCSVSLQHVPFENITSHEAKLLCTVQHGLKFEAPLEALPLGLGDERVIGLYKKAVRVRPEQKLLGAVLNHQNNAGIVIDQEIAFPGNTGRIDLCYFDRELQKLAFVEIKRFADPRLLSCGGMAPEVLTQLKTYAEFFAAERECILESFRQAIKSKRDLGLGERVCNIPKGNPTDLLMKPILAIGGCDKKVAESILNGDDRWRPLMNGLRKFAAGLYLFGNAGFTLGLSPGRQTLVWPESQE